MEEDTKGIYENEIPMANLVAEEKHTERATSSTTEEGEEEECLLRDAPCAELRLDFVNHVKKKGDGRDGAEDVESEGGQCNTEELVYN